MSIHIDVHCDIFHVMEMSAQVYALEFRIKPMDETYGDRLKKLREERGLSVRDVAKRSEGGVGHAYVGNIENGYSSWEGASLRIIKGIARAFDMHVTELIKEVEGKAKPIETLYRQVPILGYAEAGQPFDYPVPTEIYRPGMAVFQVKGDSMDTGSPDSIRDSDYVFVDRSISDLQDGKVYVIHIEAEGYTVKRARKLNGSFYLTSDNADYPSFKPRDGKVIGLVFCAFGQKSV